MDFTTDTRGAKPLDRWLPLLRSAHQTSGVNFENRQRPLLDEAFRLGAEVARAEATGYPALAPLLVKSAAPKTP